MHNYTKIAASTLSGFLIARFGWVGALAVVWIVAMALDYITGSAAAMKAGEWSSAVARKGLFHKGGSIAVVCVAALAQMCIEIATQGGLPIPQTLRELLLPLVLAWYILTESGSIVENAVKLGAKSPKWLKDTIDKAKDAVDGEEQK